MIFPYRVSMYFENVVTRSWPLKLWTKSLTLRKSLKSSWMPPVLIPSPTVSVTPRHVLNPSR